jgi:hypothetical protein
MLKAYPSKKISKLVHKLVSGIVHKEEYQSFSGSQEYDPIILIGIKFWGGLKFDSGISLGVRYHLGLEIYNDEGKAQNRVLQFQ